MSSLWKFRIRGLIFLFSFLSVVCWGKEVPAPDTTFSSQGKILTKKEITQEHIPVLVYSSEETKEALVEFKLADLPKLPVSGFEVIDPSGYALPYQIDDLDNSNSSTKDDVGIFLADLEKGLNIFYFLINQGRELEIAKRWEKESITVKGSSYQATVDNKGVIKTLRFLKEDGTVLPDNVITTHDFGFTQSSKYLSPADKIKNISFCSGPLRTIIIADGDYKSDTGSNFHSLYRMELTKGFLTLRYSLKFLDDNPTFIGGQIYSGMSYNPKFFTQLKYLVTDETTDEIITKIAKTDEIKHLSHGVEDTIVWVDLEGAEYGLVEFKKRPLRGFKWGKWEGISRTVYYSWPQASYCKGDEVVDEGMLFPYPSKSAPEIENLVRRFHADICASPTIETFEIYTRLKGEVKEYRSYLESLKGIFPFQLEIELNVKDIDSKLIKMVRLWKSGKISDCKRLFNKTEERFRQFKEKLPGNISSALDSWWESQEENLEKEIMYLKDSGLNFATPQIMLSNAEVCKNGAKLYFKKMGTPLIEICKSRPYPRAIEEIQRAFSLCKNAEEAIKVIKERKIKNLLPEKEVKNPLFYFTIHATGIFPEYRWLNPPVQKKRTLEIWDEFKAIGLDVMCGGLSVYTIEPEEGKFNLDWMKEAVEECKKRDIKLVPYLGLWGTGGACGHHFTLLEWFQEKYKDARPVLAMEKYVGTLPVYDMLDEFQKGVMDAIGKEPNIIAWCGNNETAAGEKGYDEHSVKSFQGWLKDKHGTINHLNECWETEYGSFEGINPPDYKQGVKGGVSLAIWYDWILFRCQAVGSTDAIVTRMIQKNDPLKRPASPRGLSETFMVMKPDHAGMGSHYNQYSSDWWCFDQACQDVFFFHNYHHGLYEVPWVVNGAWSASKGRKPILITEAGPCQQVCPFYWGIPKPEELNCYWQAVGQGLKGAHLESYGISDTSPRCFYHRDGSPKDTLLRIGEMNQIAKVLKPLLADAKPQKGEVAIYYPRATMIHDGSDEGFLGGFFGRFFQPWLSLYKSGIPVEFLAMDTIDELKDYKVLVLPSSAYLEEKCISPIKEFVRNGGLLIGEGAISFWDEYGRRYKESPGGLIEIFGAEIDTNEQNDTEVKITDRLPGRKVGAKIELDKSEFSYSLQPTTGKVTAKYTGSGKPAIVYNRYHKGKAILFGYPTANLKEDITHPWIQEFFGEYIPRGQKKDELLTSSIVQLGKVSPPVHWKGKVDISLLWNEELPIILVVSNLDKEEKVQLKYSSDAEYGANRWFDILTSEQVDKRKGALEFKMSPHQVRVIVPEVQKRED